MADSAIAEPATEESGTPAGLPASTADQVSELLADQLHRQLHRFDQQQRLFRLQVEQQTTALTERTLDLEQREAELRRRESELALRETRQAPPLPSAARPLAGADLPSSSPLAAAPQSPGNLPEPPSDPEAGPASPPEPTAGTDASRPASKAQVQSPVDAESQLEPTASLALEREKLHREKLLFESRIRFQQEHLQRTLRDLEGRQHRFQREQQQGQARLVEREHLLALRERQVQTALERLANEAGRPSMPAPLSPPPASATNLAEQAWEQHRQAWEQSRQQEQAALDQQRAELALVVQELDHRRQQLLELYATVERARAQLVAAEQARSSQADAETARRGRQSPHEQAAPANVGRVPAGRTDEFPTNEIAAARRTPTAPDAAEFAGEPEEIVVVEHAGEGDVTGDADYSTVYRPLAPSLEEQSAGLREELAAVRAQLQSERDAWAHERQQWTQWADGLEARHARELDQYRQRDAQWQQEAQRWQADRDEARAVIVDLLARVNALTATP
ncbi:MAG: hypothetical protein ACKOJF_08555 [Planctomycetaceae bacterium]